MCWDALVGSTLWVPAGFGLWQMPDEAFPTLVRLWYVPSSIRRTMGDTNALERYSSQGTMVTMGFHDRAPFKDTIGFYNRVPFEGVAFSPTSKSTAYVRPAAAPPAPAQAGAMEVGASFLPCCYYLDKMSIMMVCRVILIDMYHHQHDDDDDDGCDGDDGDGEDGHDYFAYFCSGIIFRFSTSAMGW